MAKHFVTLLWVSAALTATLALPTSDKASGSENDLVASIYTDCLKKESISCIKYKVFTFVDKMLADKEDITLSEGITVVKTSNAEGEGAPRLVVVGRSVNPSSRLSTRTFKRRTFNLQELLYLYLHFWQIYRIQRFGYAIVRSSWKIPEDAFGQS